MHHQRNSEREKKTRGYEQSEGDKYKNKAGNIAWKQGKQISTERRDSAGSENREVAGS